MIKKIALILMISMIMTGCSNTQEELKESASDEIDNGVESVEKNSENSIKSETDNMSEYKIIDAGNFSDGVAWVYIKDSDSYFRWICVEPSGEILFRLDTSIKPTSKFSNGIATLSDNTIIDKSGQIIASPELTGYKEIVDLIENFDIEEASYSSSENEIIKDGGVCVRKIEESYNGDKEVLGIVNSKGEWVTELSEEFASTSYNNALFEGPIYNEGSDTERNKPEYNSNYGFGFKNSKGEYIDVSRYTYIHELTPFYKGHCALILGEESGSKWITVIDDSGNELFSPKKLDDSSLMHIDDGMYCLSEIYETQGETKYKRVFYDFNGDKLFEVNTESNIRIFSEGYAFVEPIDTDDKPEYGYFIDKNGNKLWSDN